MSSEYSPWNWFRSRFIRIVGFTVLILWSITAIYPFIWTALTSLKTNQELYTNIWGLPANPQWQNYFYAWTTGGIGGTNSVETGFINSIIVTALSIAILFVIAPMSAFALGRAEYRGKSTTLYLLIAGMYIAPQISLVPLFVLFAGLGLTNSLLGLVIVYVSSGLPYAVFISRLGFLSIPSSLEDAAKVDGLSTFQTYWRVALPLAMPTVLIAMILEAIFVWNDFLYPLVFINSPNLNTLQLTLYNNFFNVLTRPQYGALSAGIVISTVPLLVLYLIFSDRIKKGVAAGIGVKT
jgi:raffinose/stachyose/melibiose transport system permease protein